ncbi:MAG: D-Ala-D-Ala carboxypeptidase family metallohydrolase [Armatimonadota bacterium]|nr:D-Ala-D-Ala carboxypeptidase family metallohydrolase [Armatimonadota bacterium]
MRLSKHFTLDEFTFSQTAIRQGLDNAPDESHIEHMRALCVNVLEPLRAVIGKPIQITSGYRSPKVNAAIGGSRRSQHIEGKAADIVCPAIGTLALFKALVRAGLPYDQLIFEGTWVHVSYDESRSREEILLATFKAGRATYTALTKRAALTLA